VRATAAGLQADAAKLASQVIASPDALKQTLQQLQTNLRRETEAAQGLEHKSRDLAVRVEALAALEAELERCTQLLAEGGHDLARLEEAQRLAAAGQENVARAEANVRDAGLKDQVRHTVYLCTCVCVCLCVCQRER
jgi:chromosome segregation ATPase